MSRAVALTALIATPPAQRWRLSRIRSGVAAPDRCEEIPGGEEEVAVLAGDYRGRQVSSRFTHAIACVAGRWDRIAPVFPTGL